MTSMFLFAVGFGLGVGAGLYISKYALPKE